MEEIDLKKIRLLTPMRFPVMEEVEPLIREHERRFQWDGAILPIEFFELANGARYIEFVKTKEWTRYKDKQDEEWSEMWAEKLGAKMFAMNFVMKIKDISKVAEFEVRAGYEFMRHARVPMQTLQNMIALTAWHFTGYKAYGMWPLGDNPYEPTVRLLQLGYVPRRLPDRWLVGWRRALGETEKS